jgi:5-methylcytosine-specific restriction enzyme A
MRGGTNPTFRNANGVYLKLSNFLAVAPPGHGMRRINRKDREVFHQFANDDERLRELAAAILRGAAQVEGGDVAPSEDDEDAAAFPEGRVLYRLHRMRERSRLLMRRKKAQVLRREGALRCEVCQFDFELVYGVRGRHFIECHHTVPVSTLAVGATPELKDLALVRANCHRMLHRSRQWMRLEELRTLIAVGAGHTDTEANVKAPALASGPMHVGKQEMFRRTD